MQIKENYELIKNKHLLLRQVENKIISQEEFDSKIIELNKKINSNILNCLTD